MPLRGENRRIVRDSGRSVHPEPTESDKAFIKAPLDRDIVAMTGAFRIVAMQTLKLADKAGIDHLKVYFAMLNGASDSTPGDRAYAGAAYVIATSEGMTDIAREIMAGRADRALGHATSGPALQQNLVCVMESR